MDHRLFLMFFADIYFRGWHLSKFFAGTYFRGWGKNPRKPRKLFSGKVNPIKIPKANFGMRIGRQPNVNSLHNDVIRWLVLPKKIDRVLLERVLKPEKR